MNSNTLKLLPLTVLLVIGGALFYPTASELGFLGVSSTAPEQGLTTNNDCIGCAPVTKSHTKGKPLFDLDQATDESPPDSQWGDAAPEDRTISGLVARLSQKARLWGHGPSDQKTGTRLKTAKKGKSNDFWHPDLNAPPPAPVMRGTQEMKVVPLRDNPEALALLRRAEAVDAPAFDTNSPPPVIVNAYVAMTSPSEKKELLTDVEQSKRVDAANVYLALFDQEKDPEMKQEILTLAMESKDTAGASDILEAALTPNQDTNVRLAALYYAHDIAPSLVKLYINDPNVQVRDDARSILEEISGTAVPDTD